MIPFCNFIYGVMQVIIIKKYLRSQRDAFMMSHFKKYALYLGTYVVLNFFLILAYLLDFIINKGKYIPTNHDFPRYSIYLITLLTIASPMLIGLLRIFQLKFLPGLILFFKKITKKNTTNLDETFLTEDADESFGFFGLEKTAIIRVNFNI